MKTVVRLALVDPHENTRNSLKNLLVGIETVWVGKDLGIAMHNIGRNGDHRALGNRIAA